VRSLFASSFRQCRLGCLAFGTTVFASTLATTRAARTRACSTTTTRCRLRLCSLFGNHFGWRAFDHRLRPAAVNGGCHWSRSHSCYGNGSHRCGFTGFDILGSSRTLRPLMTTVTALVAISVATVLARLLILALRLLALWLLLTTRLMRLGVGCIFANHRLLTIAHVFAVAAVHVVLIDGVTVAVLEVAAILVLEAILHLRLRGSNDAVIVLCVLQIVLCHDTVAGALCVPSKLGIFFGNMLSGPADLDVRSGAIVGPAEGIAPLAVEIVIVAAAAIVVIAAPSTAIFLLSWPHISFTNSLSSLIRATRPSGHKPEQDFACRAQGELGVLPLV
jgi:hypothetical protein